jgi:hypothetical protein
MIHVTGQRLEHIMLNKKHEDTVLEALHMLSHWTQKSLSDVAS